MRKMRPMRTPPRLVALAVSLALAACGAAPTAGDAPPPAPDLGHVLGGGYVLACWGGQTLTAWRPMRREVWRFPAAEAPVRVEVVADRVPAGGCGAERTTVGAVPADVGDGRLLTVSTDALRLTRGATLLWTRTATGPLTDAAASGDALLLVGPRGLFRWRAGAGEPQAVALPEVLVGRPLVGLFRDGPVFWARDADGQSWPLVVNGEVATRAGEPQVMVPGDTGLRLPLPGGRLEATRGLDGLRVLDAAGLLTLNLETPPVDALALLPGGRVLVAAGDTLRLLRWPETGPLSAPVDEGRHTLPGRTVRLFTLEKEVVAIGDYGVLRVPLP
jgi:hypothetical protein